MVSFNVNSLLTNVPIPEVLNVFEELKRSYKSSWSIFEDNILFGQ